ncbi:MAG: cytochrome c [Gemmatimonadota bacterium]
MDRMNQSEAARRWARWLGAAVVVAIALPAHVHALTSNGPGDDEVPTFSRDIAPILQANCQECHQPGSIAPMSLLTYDEVRPWAPLIRVRVSERIMPPWHVNPYLGIQEFKNDVSLSEEEIATIVAWVDGGAPEGDPADLPAPATFDTGEEYRMLDVFGPPDLVVKTTPFTVPANGNDQWWRPVVSTGLTEDRWVRAVEVLPAFPAGRTVTHHVLATAVQQHNLGGLLTEWAIGKVGEVYAEGTGKLLQAGSEVEFEIHYYPSGTEVVDDQVSLGIWLYPEGYVPEYETTLRIFNVAPQNTLEIPPHSTVMFQNEFVMRNPVRIQSFQPHMHLRGKGMSMEAIYPNGRKELLSIVDNFQFNWHNNYIYADDAAPLLPTGTVLKFTTWFDNTENHPSNPHPGDFVTWGDRAADEMGHAWVGVTNLTEEEFERLVREREAIQSVAGF